MSCYIDHIDHVDNCHRFANCIGWCNGYRARLIVGSRQDHAGQTKDYSFGICCFTARHAALRSKSKELFCFESG